MTLRQARELALEALYRAERLMAEALQREADRERRISEAL